MKLAGGILAIIGGVFGIIGALLNFGVAGLGSIAVQQGTASQGDVQAVAWFGILGLVGTILVIIFGALCIKAKRKIIPLTLITISALVVPVGGFVSFCMVLPFIGGILALVATKRNAEE